ncbi:MAG TPA: glycosyltransferase family 4 protein [Catalimonadaceae bacterium]|nr:glycosyltransferase family 4 protein [Catalimonadaceae bacterium]HPI11524.1 glycosyltransferase family 4 protein [Catalimonadaceae bacterium]
MARTKVLMLGWEFPPVLTGGLGTACYGLVKALSKYADVQLIIPQADRNQTLENVRIKGLNYYGITGEQSIELPEVPLEEYAKVTKVPAEFSNPYPVGIGFAKEAKALVSPEAIRALYSTSEPYGPNIMQKVATYAEVVSRMALEMDFDVIHAHDWITYPAAVKIKEMTGKPLVVHVHSLETDRVGEKAKGDWNKVYEVEFKGMSKADRVIPVSRYTQDCAMAHYNIPEEKFYPVHNAIDPAETFRIPNNSGEKLVLFLGRVTFQKGPEFMVETAWKLLQVYPNVLFFVAGVGDMMDELKKKVLERKIDHKFVFAGFLSKSNVKKVLAQADVYFMPSVSEPFGLSALEAAQFDVPCVISKQSGVAEVLPNALNADFWDTESFANYIYGLLNYEGIREDMISKTRKDIAQLTWDDSARDVMEVYESLGV